jgi:hypothetical protein
VAAYSNQSIGFAVGSTTDDLGIVPFEWRSAAA